MIIKFETAKIAKEKGFTVISRYGTETSLYEENGDHAYYGNYGLMYLGLDKNYIYAPLQSELQKWLREEYKIFVEVNLHSDLVFWVDIIKAGKRVISEEWTLREDKTDKYYSTYEEALEAGLIEALKTI